MPNKANLHLGSCDRNELSSQNEKIFVSGEGGMRKPIYVLIAKIQKIIADCAIAFAMGGCVRLN
jgi:hypothetical protein